MQIKRYYHSVDKGFSYPFLFIINSMKRGVLLILFTLLSIAGYSQSRTYTSGGTFLVPAGVTSLSVQCWGAGGGGSTTSSIGGGGGGGAYASGTVAVLPGNTYNIVIGTRGSSGVNGTGTSFNGTSIFAAGGSSAANNSSVGGAGGSAALSIGTIKYAGGNGANGSGTVAGGGGGGAGSTGAGNNASTYIRGAAKTLNGGAGGNGRRLTRGNGSNGSNYGGGGGGAYGNGTTANGGVGANGLAIISWTCPVYSLSSVSVPLTVCRGSAARITLNGSPANLPVGSYTVTYNLSAPNAVTNRTVAMTVTSAGTGSFNTIALNTAGATTITITRLTSGATGRNCVSTISSNNTAVISMNNAIPVITTQPVSQAVCAGAAVTLSVTATDVSRYQWRKNGINISGATASTYNIPSYCSCDAGAYSVVLANSCGNRSSANAYISTKAPQNAVTASSSASVICAGTAVNLACTSPSASVTLLYENFNGTSNNFTTANTSTGGTPANAAWSLRPNGYVYNTVTFNSNDNSQFYISNSNAQGSGGATATILQTAPFSTMGIGAATLNFYQYYRFNTGAERARVEISTNGTSWTALATYAGTQGAANNFALVTINLAAYLNRPMVMIRFRYTATTAWYWAIDNVNVSGTLAAPSTFSWSSTPAGYSASVQNPGSVSPLTSTDYKVTVTNSAGCTSSSTVPVTVNTAPSIHTQPFASAPVCSGNGTQTITVGASGTGLIYQWRKNGIPVVNSAVVSGQGTASLVLTNPTAINEGVYDVIISGTCSPSVTSGTVTISLNTNTSIAVPASPLSQTVLINNLPTALSLSAAGTSLTYQWYSNSTNNNSGGISAGAANGAQTNSYTPPTTTEGTIYYYCTVTGACGTATSGTVLVTVTNSNIWSGGGNSNWSNSSNWSMGTVPTATNDAVIPSGNIPYPVLSSSAIVNNLTIGSGATVTIGSNELRINGTVNGTGTITGSDHSSLVIGGNAGTIFFTPGSTNNYLKNFTVENGATATLGNALNITGGASPGNEGLLTVTGSGILTAGGYLTIKSNEFGTAAIAPGNIAGGYIQGDVTVERYIPKNASKSWRLLASNTSGQTINQAWQEGVTGSLQNPNPGFGIKITSSGASLAAVQALGFDTLSLGKSIFKYIPSTDILDYVPNTNSTALNSEHGYFVFIRGDRSIGQFGGGAPLTSTVLRSKGTLYQGDQPAVNVAAGQYAVVRNPFASRIDIRQIVRAGGVAAAFQVWDPKLTGAYGGGAFQTFSRNNLTGDFEVSPGGGSFGANGSVQNFIESGSAFYVQSAGSAGTVQVTENCKTAGSGVAGFRPSAPASATNRILFNLYAVNPGSTDIVDGGFIDFNEAYSNDVDIQDVRKNQNFYENFGIERNNTELVVERRQAIQSSDTVSFKMYNLRRISYQLDIQVRDFDTLLTTAFLHDNYTGADIALNFSVINSYIFSISSEAQSYAADRFKILLRQAAVLPVAFVSVNAVETAGKIKLQWNIAHQVNINRYEIERSADGISFVKQAAQPALKNNQVYQWTDQPLTGAVNFYRIKAVELSGEAVYSRIVKVVSKAPLQGIDVLTNPVRGNAVTVRFSNQPAGQYYIKLMNDAGQLIASKQINHTSLNMDWTIELPSQMHSGSYQLLLYHKSLFVKAIRIVK